MGSTDQPGRRTTISPATSMPTAKVKRCEGNKRTDRPHHDGHGCVPVVSFLRSERASLECGTVYNCFFWITHKKSLLLETPSVERFKLGAKLGATRGTADDPARTKGRQPSEADPAGRATHHRSPIFSFVIFASRNKASSPVKAARELTCEDVAEVANVVLDQKDRGCRRSQAFFDHESVLIVFVPVSGAVR